MGMAMIGMSTTGNSITEIYFSVSLTEVDLYVTVLGKGSKNTLRVFFVKDAGQGANPKICNSFGFLVWRKVPPKSVN